MFIQKFEDKVKDTLYVTERRKSSVRSISEVEIDDVLGMFDVIDKCNALQNVVFAATNLDRVPKFGPEDTNVCSIAEKQANLEAVVSELQQRVFCVDTVPDLSGYKIEEVRLAGHFDKVHQRIETLDANLTQKVELLKLACDALGSNVASSSAAVGRPTEAHSLHTSEIIDRSMNLVMFGVRENREASAWRTSVDQALEFLVGRPVESTDMFRIGKFLPNKVRPIIVKLRSQWDKHLILSKRLNLRNYNRDIFIAPDEPLDVHRRNTLDRLKQKAIREGKHVTVSGDLLTVDGVNVYSLKEGPLNRS
jgi:hypothetical protein